MAFPIDKNKEMLKWGPIDGRLIYPDFFTLGFVEFSKKKFHTWPDLLGLFSQGKMTYIGDMDKIRNYGAVNFNRFVLPKKQRELNYRNWKKHTFGLLKIQKAITPQNLKTLTKKGLFSLYDLWSKNYLKFWRLGFLPEFAGWGGEAVLKRELEKSFQGQTFIKIFEALSAPESLSFYQKANLELYKLKRWQKNQKIFWKKLNQYQQKHFWILNSYAHSKILTIPYFKRQLEKISLKQVAQKIKQLADFPEKIKKEKLEIAKRYKVNKHALEIAKALAFCVNWQDQRKYYIFLANHIIDIFLKEAARSFRLDFDAMHNYNHHEIHGLFKRASGLSASENKRRKLAIVTHYIEKTNRVKYLSGQPAKKIIDYYLKPAKIKSHDFLTGIVVSKGPIIKGKVRIILSSKEVEKMKKGEVLVATMTSPDFIVAMKKAKAVITDSGGMTSHAAIISRELKIPCIVNTLHATHVLKNGQKITVNTKQGIIKVI